MLMLRPHLGHCKTMTLKRQSAAVLCRAEDSFAEPPQRGLEIALVDISQTLVKQLTFLAFERAAMRRRRGRIGERRPLLQRESRDGAVAEKRVDAFDQHGFAMLHLKAEAGSDSEMQRALAPFAARKGELLGSDARRQALADDRRPLRHELRFGEAAFAEDGAGDLRHLRRDRPHPAAPLLVQPCFLLIAAAPMLALAPPSCQDDAGCTRVQIGANREKASESRHFR